jgi:L-amino acid N-acyltransferase YncA
MIRDVDIHDASALTQIYNPYVLDSVITFEEQVVADEQMAERVREVLDSGLPWLVCEDDGGVRGFAYAAKWKRRCAYRHSAEVTVYLQQDATGHGLGSQLYADLLQRLRAGKLHVAIGGIALPNPASVALHERLGFRKVAHFAEVGFKFERWIDVGYWQLVL